MKNDSNTRHVNARAECEGYDGIPETLYIAFADDFIEITSNKAVAASWNYITREYQHKPHPNEVESLRWSHER